MIDVGTKPRKGWDPIPKRYSGRTRGGRWDWRAQGRPNGRGQFASEISAANPQADLFVRLALAEFDAKPRTGVGPPGVGGAGGDAEDLGALVEGKAAETA